MGWAGLGGTGGREWHWQRQRQQQRQQRSRDSDSRDSIALHYQDYAPNVLGLLVGFMLGVLIRNSAGALAAYFVYAFLLPTLSLILATSQEWFRELQPWVSFSYAQGALFDTAMTSTQWAQLGVTGVLWLLVPLGFGVWLLLRSEVK